MMEEGEKKKETQGWKMQGREGRRKEVKDGSEGRRKEVKEGSEGRGSKGQQ
jgi:hypothetical protein